MKDRLVPSLNLILSVLPISYSDVILGNVTVLVSSRATVTGPVGVDYPDNPYFVPMIPRLQSEMS